MSQRQSLLSLMIYFSLSAGAAAGVILLKDYISRPAARITTKTPEAMRRSISAVMETVENATIDPVTPGH